ncbi:unnamed protein product, partial [Porites evermanni]
DSIEQATSSSGEQRTRAKTERVSGRLGPPRSGHLASLSGAHSHVSSAEACLSGASAEERGEGHQKEKREMTGVRALRFSALSWLASLTARKE